jgi:DNA-binding response OmpR family regulator
LQLIYFEVPQKPIMHSTKLTILIIDDSAELLEVFKIVFEKQGYNIITKSSSADIIAFIQNNSIDILLLDVFLDNINGRHICKQLKSDPSTNYFPIVLMSASPENLQDLDECNADGYIEKPFDIKYVVKKIEDLLVNSKKQKS